MSLAVIFRLDLNYRYFDIITSNVSECGESNFKGSSKRKTTSEESVKTVVLQKHRVENFIQQQMRALPILGTAMLPIAAAIILFISMGSSLYAQSTPPKDATEVAKPPKGVADTSKVVVTEEYLNDPEKKTVLFDSSGRQLSTQQMVDFLKSELKKLNVQINTIGHKASPDSSNDSNANDIDVMKLFIIKGKLESMEKTLDEWTMQRDKEMNPDQKYPSPNSPQKNKK